MSENTNKKIELNAVEKECLKQALQFLKETLQENSITVLGGTLPTNPGVSGNMLITHIASRKYDDCVVNVKN